MGDPLLYSLALIVFALFLIKLFTTKSSQKYKNLPPSPPCLPIIGHLHLLRQPVHRTLQFLSGKYGKIQLLRWGSRQVLLVTSPSIAEECFTKHDILFSNRPLLLAGKHFHYNYTTVVMAPYGDHWRNLRRIMSLEFFSSSRLAMFSSIRQREVRLLLDHVLKSCQGKTATKIELKSKLTDLSFNAMTMMVLGKRYYGEDAGDAEDAKRFREAIREVVELNAATNLVDFLPFYQWIDVSRTEKKMVSLMAKMDSFLQVLVSDRRRILSSNCDPYNGGEVRKLLIDNLLTEPELYTDEILKGDSGSIIDLPIFLQFVVQLWHGFDNLVLLFISGCCKGFFDSQILSSLGICPRLRKAPKINYVLWQPPIAPWVKVNTDGLAKGNPDPAACGGVFRDAYGSFLGSFCQSLGCNSSFYAELYAVEVV